MDKIKNFQKYIQQIFKEYAKLSSSDPDVDTETVFDTERNHYLLVYAGWKNRQRMYGCVLHLDIKNDKIWIQYNGTEMDVAEELVKLGVSRNDIVLGLHEPFMRQFTDYAVE